jgi:hypothetical protein
MLGALGTGPVGGLVKFSQLSYILFSERIVGPLLMISTTNPGIGYTPQEARFKNAFATCESGTGN